MSDENQARLFLKSIKETVHLLSSTLEEREVGQILLDRVVSGLSVRKALLLLLNPEANTFLPGSAVGLSKEYVAGVPVSIDESPVNQRLMAGEAAVIADLALAPEFRDAGALQEGLKGMVAVPVSIRGRVIGAIHAYYPDTLSEQHLQTVLLLETLADLGAMVLEKVRLHNSLYRMAEALNSPFDLKRMLKMVLGATVEEMWLKGASIRLFDKKSGILNLVAAHGLSEAYCSKRGEMPLTDRGIDEPVMKGETVLIHDLKEETRFKYLDETVREGIRSILAVPLILKTRILGVMRVYSTRPRSFGPAAVTFLRSAADLVSLAIENAELYAALEKRNKDLKLDLADWHRFLTLG